MIRTKVTQTSALAGFAPAGKPGYTNRQGRACHTRNSMEALGHPVCIRFLDRIRPDAGGRGAIAGSACL